MTSSSASRSLTIVLTVVVSLWLTGCAARYGVPKIKVSSLTVDRTSPQMASTGPIRWTAEVSGGVGPRTYEFHVKSDAGELLAQRGGSATWIWNPVEAGVFRVKVVARDDLGLVASSDWSPPFQIVEKLALGPLTPDKTSPRPAGTVNVHWSAEARGGVGGKTFEFWLDDGDREVRVQSAPWSLWVWSPRTPGNFRVRLIIRDSAGHEVDSGWSLPYEITPALQSNSTIAVLPPENLSGARVPLDSVQGSLMEALRNRSIQLLDEDALERFMAAYRLRHTGGLSTDLAGAFGRETGVDAVLISSVDLHDENVPPKFAVTFRLVSTGEKTSILWMDSATLAGDESPGAFSVGVVDDIRKLRERVLERVADSVAGRMGNPGSGDDGNGSRKFRPRSFRGTERSPLDRPGIERVAVLPLSNLSGRRNAGEVVMLQLVRQLTHATEIEVIEPGVVRQALLQARLIMPDGLSFPQAELLRAALDAHLVLAGDVTEYRDGRGPTAEPRVEFTVRAIDTAARRVVWTSLSYNRGDDGVFFFDLGRVRTAQALTAAMSRDVVRRMLESGRRSTEIDGTEPIRD